MIPRRNWECWRRGRFENRRTNPGQSIAGEAGDDGNMNVRNKRVKRKRLLVEVCRTVGIDSETVAEQGQILKIFSVHSGTMGQGSDAIWTA